MTSSLVVAGTAGKEKEAPAENKEKSILSDVHDDLPSQHTQWRYFFAASALIAVGATAFGIHKRGNTTITINNNEELAVKDKTSSSTNNESGVCNDGAFDITFHEPEESYKGDIAEILVTDMIEGSLVLCEWEDGDFYEGIVQNTHYDSDDSEEALLVIWYEDALEEWVPAQDCELMDEQIIWKAGQFRYNIHQDHRFDEFHRAFKAVAEEFPDSPPALFTYWGGSQVVTSLEGEKDVIDIALNPLAKDFAKRENPQMPIYHVSCACAFILHCVWIKCLFTFYYFCALTFVDDSKRDNSRSRP